MGILWLEMDHLRLETGLLRHETNSRLMLTYIQGQKSGPLIHFSELGTFVL